MNNRNRHMQYRKSVYRKRRIRAAIILSVCAVILVFALFIIIGTVLYNKTQQPSFDDGEFEYNKTDENALDAAPSIGAYALPLLEDGSNFSTRLNSIPEGANAACVNLNTSDGILNYSSQIAKGISGITVAADASSLSSYLSSIEGKDLYTTGVFYLTALAEDNDLVEDIELSIAGALSCEAIRAGVGDVLFIAPAVDENDTEKLCLLADKIHATEEDAIIGFVISDAVLNSENSISIIDELSKHFNYLCLDVTSYTDKEPLEYIESRISDMQLDLIYYKMRVLLPRSADATVQKQYIEIAEKYNITSWQILP